MYTLNINEPKGETETVRTTDGDLVVKYGPYIAEMRVSARGCTKAQYAEKLLKYSIAGTTVKFVDDNTIVVERTKRAEIPAPKVDSYTNNLNRIDYGKPTIQYDGEPVVHQYPERWVLTEKETDYFEITNEITHQKIPRISLINNNLNREKEAKLISMGLRNNRESRY